MSLLVIEAYPREAPPWARALHRDIKLLLRLQIASMKQLGHLQEEVIHMDHNVDEVLADIAEESTQIDGLSTLTADIKAKLDAALSGQNIPPEVQAKINSIFDGVEANKAKVMGAINANTPAAPVDPTAPGDGSGSGAS